MDMKLIVVFLLVLVCLDNVSSEPDRGDREQGRKISSTHRDKIFPGNISWPSAGGGSAGKFSNRPYTGGGSFESFSKRPSAGGDSAGRFSNAPFTGGVSAGKFSNWPSTGGGSADSFSNRPAAEGHSVGRFSNRPAAGGGSARWFSNRPAAGGGSDGWFSNRPAAGVGSDRWLSNNDKKILTYRDEDFPGNIPTPYPTGGWAGGRIMFSGDDKKICPEGTAFYSPSNQCRKKEK